MARKFSELRAKLPPEAQARSAALASAMGRHNAVIERCPDTGLYVGHVPGIAGAHAQGATLEELEKHLSEVLELLGQNTVPGHDPR